MASDLSALCLIVDTKVSAPVRPQEPDDYVLHHDSTLLALEEENEDGRPLAKLRWARVAISAAVDDGVSLFDVFDAASADLCAIYESLFTEDGTLKAPFDADVVDEVLYFEGLELLERAYDEQAVAEEIIEHVLHFFGGQALATFFRGQEDSLRFVAALRARGLQAVEGDHGAPLYAVPLCRRRPPLKAC
jgi:hypothetical protein